MIILPCRKNKIVSLILMIMCIVFIICLFVFYKSIELVLYFFGIFGTIAIGYYISLSRIFVLDAEGCTVKIGIFQRKYLWNQMKIRRYCNYDNSVPIKELMQCGVEFSYKKLARRNILKPSLYSLMFAPFSLCYIYFPFSTEGTQYKNYKEYLKQNPMYYMCDDKEFFEKMKEWNVEFEDFKIDKNVKRKNLLISSLLDNLVIISFCCIRFVFAIGCIYIVLNIIEILKVV